MYAQAWYVTRSMSYFLPIFHFINAFLGCCVGGLEPKNVWYVVLLDSIRGGAEYGEDWYVGVGCLCVYLCVHACVCTCIALRVCLYVGEHEHIADRAFMCVFVILGCDFGTCLATQAHWRLPVE